MAAACGEAHTVLVSEDGAALWVMGSGKFGKLGVGDELPRYCPAPLSLADDSNPCASGGGGDGTSLASRAPALAVAPVVAVAAGANHTAAVTSDGELWCWGDGSAGQLGLGDSDTRQAPTPVPDFRECWGGVAAVMAACGRRHTLVLTAGGVVWSSGEGTHGRLGHGDEASKTRFFPVAMPVRCVMVAAGDRHSAAIDERGEVFTWGYGAQGALGHTDDADRREPHHLRRLGGRGGVVMVSAAMHTVAVTAEGELWAWGAGEDGQLGVGVMANRLTPTRVGVERPGLGCASVVLAACGYRHTLAGRHTHTHTHTRTNTHTCTHSFFALNTHLYLYTV